MNICLISIDEYLKKTDLSDIEKYLFDRGYNLKSFFQLKDADEAEYLYTSVKDRYDAFIISGEVSFFYKFLNEKFHIESHASVLEIEGKPYAISSNPSLTFIRDTVIPMLNSYSKTLYTTTIFKTFGKTAMEVKDILKEHIKNKNRILFTFFEDLCECAVHIRYSSKTSKTTVDELIAAVAAKLNSITYAVKETSLQDEAAELLRLRHRKLKTVESFTGGGIASTLIGYAGISDYFKEGLVTYSNLSKIERVNVEPQVIENYGAVSIETIYEMAANLLMTEECDLVLATSGNAGPTSEKDGEVGKCFIAVGDDSGIHIYQYRFEGDRETVIRCGIKAAFYRLILKLKENDFQNLINDVQ